MAAIDLVLLGLIKKQPQSAYELQKSINYRNIDRWVAISTPSIYKKVLTLKDKGYLQSMTMKHGGLPEKTIYDLTPKGDAYFIELMQEHAKKPIGLFLDFNAVMLHLDLVDEPTRKDLLANIQAEIRSLRKLIETNIQAKSHIPQRGKLILQQQLELAKSLEDWIKDITPSAFV